MRAIVITRAGGPEVLEVQERPLPEPGRGEIRVRVRASALNRADILQRAGRYPAPPGAPADIGGLEYAGEVDSLGAATTDLWKVGDRVMGVVGGGAHAEFVRVHEREAIRIPGNMSWEEAAAVPEVFLTAYDALETRLHLRAGERLLIHAVGSGVGTAAVQLARVTGAAVAGTARSSAKLEAARRLGLDLGVDAGATDWPSAIESALGAESVNAVLDLVGGDYLAGNLRVLAPRGRMALVGLTAGATAHLDMALLLRKRLMMVGTAMRTRSLEEKIALAREFSIRVLPSFEAGHIRPVIDRILSFEEIRAAHSAMQSNETFGKIVLRWSSP